MSYITCTHGLRLGNETDSRIRTAQELAENLLLDGPAGEGRQLAYQIAYLFPTPRLVALTAGPQDEGDWSGLRYGAGKSPYRAGGRGLSFADRFLALANEGLEVSLTYSPRQMWPNEAEETPLHRRWLAFATTVPGTDMCQYVQYGSTADKAMEKLWAELHGISGTAQDPGPDAAREETR